MVDRELYDQMHSTILCGVRASVLRAVARILVAADERNGKIALGAIMSGEFEIVLKGSAGTSEGD